MKFEEYNISDNNGKSNCVVRSLCKVLNKEYDDVFNGLVDKAKELNLESFNDIEVFESYMNDNNIIKIDSVKDTLIKDLKLDNSTYIVFCYDKKDFYHMLPIIDNTIYDKSEDSINLYTIDVYKKID